MIHATEGHQVKLHEEGLHTVAAVCNMPVEFGGGYCVLET